MTFDIILQDMLDRVPDTMDKREGSVIYDALAPCAIELAQAYMQLDFILNQTFADTADGEYLEKRCAERGVTRKESTFAVVQGEFTPTNIDVTEQRFTCGDYIYSVTATTGTAGIYQLTCETSGVAPNGTSGQLIPVDSIPGLETANITAVLIPGEDEETDDNLRNRYFDSLDSQSFGGNVADYKVKTKAIDGVGGVKVTPVWNGGGTVKLTIINSEYNVPSQTLLDAVQEEIDPTQDGSGVGLAPIGHVVTVDGVQEYTIDVELILTYQTGYSFEALESYICDVIDTYFRELAETWENNDYIIVRVAQLESRILNIQGILDIQSVELNGTGQNVSLASNQIPIRGDVTDGT